MPATRVLLSALLALASACSFGAANGVRTVETRTISAAPVPDATHELTLHAYTFRGTRWTAQQIETAVTGSANLLGQCGIALSRAELRTLDAPRRFHDYETATSRAFLRLLEVERPAIFFVEDTRNQPAFDAEAIGLANSKRRPELANTVWVAYGARDLAHALAHELAHVLADSGAHSDEPHNLMRAETAPHNDRLTPAQCELIRSRGEANGLIAKRVGTTRRDPSGQGGTK